VLVNTAPGEELAFPPVNWWNSKHVVINGNDFYLKNTAITGNEIIGAVVSALLSTAPASETVTVTDALSNTTWVMYAPVNEYMAQFVVNKHVGDGVSETAQVSFNGTDLLGNTGAGRGTFNIDTTGAIVTVSTDKDIAKLGDTIIIRAKSYLSGILPGISLKTTTGSNPITLTVKADDISYPVIDGTNIKTGEAIYSYTVQEPELANFSGIVEAGAFVTSTSKNYYYASKTMTVDTISPVLTIGSIGKEPAGIGTIIIPVSVNEDLKSEPQVKISASTRDGWVSIYPSFDSYFNNSGLVKVQIKAEYTGTSICAEAVGYDLAGNSGCAENRIFKIDTVPPAQLQNLKGKRYKGQSGIYDLLTWDAIASDDLAGYYVYMDDTLITPATVTSTSFTEILLGTNIDLNITANHKYYVAGVDNSGNIGTGAYVTVYNDSTAPVTHVDVEGTSFTASGGTIYINSASLIKLTAEDTATTLEASTSVKSTGYNFNTKDPDLFNTYGSAFACPYSNTPTALYYRSIDINGNSEDVKESNIFVDTTAPTLSISVNGPFYQGYTINGKAASIPAGFENWDRATILAAITTSVKTMTVDMFSNYTDDQLKKMVEYVVSASTNQASDGLETLSQAQLICDITTTAVNKYTVEELDAMSVSDLAVLLRSLLTVTPEYGVKFVNKNLSGFNIYGYDDFNGFTGSGIAEIDYRISTSDAIVSSGVYYSGSVKASAVGLTGLNEGLYTIEAAATDNVGNSVTFTGTGSNVMYFIVDTSAPSTSAYVTTGYDSATITSGSASVTLTATGLTVYLNASDNGSIPCGVYKTYYAIDGMGYTQYTGPINVTYGAGVLKYYSVDNVSNTENVRNINFGWYMPTATVTPTYTATATVTPTMTYTATATPTITNTATQTITDTSTPTVTETDTPTATPSVTLTATETDTPTATDTDTPTATETITETATPTDTQTATCTATPSVTPTVTETATPTATDTDTPTATETITETVTPTDTQTATCTATPSVTPTATETDTPTATYTVTLTATGTNTSTVTATYTKTFTATITGTFTATKTFTGTVTKTVTQTLTATKTITKTNTPTITLTYMVTPTMTVTATRTPLPANLKLYFKAGNLDAQNAAPHPQFRVYNIGTQAVDISKIEIRYWYEYEGTGQTESAFIDWAGISGTNISNYAKTSIVSGSFGSGQDRYISVGFDDAGGSLGNGSNDYLEADTRFNKSDNSYYDQSNDWSFVAYNTFTQWSRVTVYYDGALVWGYEPGTVGILMISDKSTPTPERAEKMSTLNVYNYPNPCKDSTMIRFSLDKPADVRIEITDINNVPVWRRNINAKDTAAGINSVKWDITNDAGKRAANGIYICSVTSGTTRVTKKIAVVK
jgi:hypothetical protein